MGGHGLISGCIATVRKDITFWHICCVLFNYIKKHKNVWKKYTGHEVCFIFV